MPRRLSLALIGLSVLAFIGLALWPQGDLAAARLFWANGRFSGRGPVMDVVRLIAWYLPFVCLAGFAIAWALARFGLIAARFAPSGRSLAFLALSLALGPGLLVNSFLKEHSHRPRPVQTRDFGGDWTFKPLYKFDGQCRRNCSFVSGETAAAFWTLAPASLAPAPWRPAAMAGALAFGAGVGLMRMAFGGHYLSDVIGAALASLLVVAATRRMLLGRKR